MAYNWCFCYCNFFCLFWSTSYCLSRIWPSSPCWITQHSEKAKQIVVKRSWKVWPHKRREIICTMHVVLIDSLCRHQHPHAQVVMFEPFQPNPDRDSECISVSVCRHPGAYKSIPLFQYLSLAHKLCRTWILSLTPVCLTPWSAKTMWPVKAERDVWLGGGGRDYSRRLCEREGSDHSLYDHGH